MEENQVAAPKPLTFLEKVLYILYPPTLPPRLEDGEKPEFVKGYLAVETVVQISFIEILRLLFNGGVFVSRTLVKTDVIVNKTYSIANMDIPPPTSPAHKMIKSVKVKQKAAANPPR